MGQQPILGKKNIVKKKPTQKPRKDADIQNLKIGTWNQLKKLDGPDLAITKTEKATLFYSGGSGHEMGVGFVVSDGILNNIKRFKSINDRLCLLQIQAKWFNIILINCYAPTEDKYEETKNDF
ncbi:craniofacial development protein 2-like [Aphis craccivora]|uniref:Craniofacial development protein 2-like n=1 Tax=Aphis craccivora TaxID=307492 RepID=A0A6G0YFP9_APHCR|nr:craniofacial development protein 2-like [Aphis craccivora]